MEQNENYIRSNKQSNLSNETREAILQFLLRHVKVDGNDALRRGTIKLTSERFEVSTRTISAIWSRAKKTMKSGELFMSASSMKKGNCGRKLTDMTSKFNEMKNVPLSQRSTIRSLAAAINVSSSSLHRALKRKEIQRHSSLVNLFKQRKSRMLDCNLQCLTYFQVDCLWICLTMFTLTRSGSTCHAIRRPII